MVDIFSPGAELPLPQNAQLAETTTGGFKITWEWEGEQPGGGFVLYFKGERDFNLFLPIIEETVPFFLGYYNFTSGEMGQPYWWRICARDSLGFLGRMTDDQQGAVGGYWSWGPAQEIGPGTDAIAAVAAENDLTAAYVNTDKVSINVARRSYGIWTVDTSVMESKWGYLDLAYASGKYLVAGTAEISLDCAIGRPGEGWENYEVVKGIPGPAGGNLPAGFSCRATGNDTEFAIISWDPGRENVYVHTKPHEESSWYMEGIKGGLVDFMHLSIAEYNSNLYVLVYDWAAHQLLFGDRAGGYSLVDIAGDPAGNLGMYNDLEFIGNGWMTPAWETVSDQLYACRQENDAWEKDLAAKGMSMTGQHARLEPYKGGAIAIFTSGNSFQREWFFSVYESGNWTVQPVILEGAHPSTDADLVVLNGEPYIIYISSGVKTVMAAKGNPPAD
jgi:hypothetical protein